MVKLQSGSLKRQRKILVSGSFGVAELIGRKCAAAFGFFHSKSERKQSVEELKAPYEVEILQIDPF